MLTLPIEILLLYPQNNSIGFYILLQVEDPDLTLDTLTRYYTGYMCIQSPETTSLIAESLEETSKKGKMSSSNKVSLGRLPPELLMEINRHLGYKETASLSRSSKYLCNVFDGLLYEDVENDSDSEKECMVLLWAAYWGRLDTIKKLRGVHLGRNWIGLFVEQIEIATRYFGIYDYWNSQAPATQV